MENHTLVLLQIDFKDSTLATPYGDKLNS
jgi:hypothetical protein